MSNKIFLSSDHAGYKLKEKVKSFLIDNNFEYEDLGCSSLEPVDYPDYAKLLSKKIKDKNNSKGILFCGTGIGISMAANRFPHIRAALCTSIEMASKSRKHNDANVLALGGRILEDKLALQIVEEFLYTDFEAGRHNLRVDKI
ncbi:MAG: ribose 5-phosphate isomerase B [Alphaproteobacteria bacterium TMED199]|jgi:ribose 5-phosphate isomerase B|nr:MAG: ribose 5-phosphate isomerase B [Alphaproteobacteria bacterium TMED199]|tara:strand:+ start:2802 stop:3230 length:429 start_codon:yes stop_codon:yes gene_type:complete